MSKLPITEGELLNVLKKADWDFYAYTRDAEKYPTDNERRSFEVDGLLQFLEQRDFDTWLPTVKNQLIPKGTHVRQEWLDEQGQPRANEWVTHATTYLGGGRQQTFFIKVKSLTEEEQQLRDLRTIIDEESDAQEILAAFKEKWNSTAKA